MERQPRDWVEWLTFLMLLIQTGIALIRKPTQKRKGSQNRRSHRKQKR